MSRQIIFSFLLLLAFVAPADAQFTLSGRVRSNTGKPVSFATLQIPALELAASASDTGSFVFRSIPAGKHQFAISSLGYATRLVELDLQADLSGFLIILDEKNLTLKDVTVVANRNLSTLSTSYLIDRAALDHMQVLSAADVTALLPGGKTRTSVHLANGEQVMAINGTSGERGNAVFGVAVEVDGVRLSNNAIPPTATSSGRGTDVRNISSTNIESVEIITGLPSVEYGDLTNGMVKINTRKGKSPLVFDVLTKPNTKQVAIGKGFDLGPDAGVLSFNLEHTRSISQIQSPYTSYARNGLGLNYSNVINRKSKRPLFVDAGITGNLGGFNSESDPDLFVNTYSKEKDNALRGNLNLRWQVNKPWLTAIEASGTFNANNKTSETSSNHSSSSSVAALHTMQDGYFVGQRYAENPDAEIILIDPGYYYRITYDENKIRNASSRLKLTWNRRFKNINNRFLLGGEWTSSRNNGAGVYYNDIAFAPTWRAWPYSGVPTLNNYAWYLEDRADIKFKSSTLRFVGGIRSDITNVKNSAYGTVSSFSPRGSVEYSFLERSRNTVGDLSVRFSFGRSVKLPSFGILFNAPVYRDYIAFAPGTTSDGRTYYAYQTAINTDVYNPDLKWQENTLREINIQARVGTTRLVVTLSEDRTTNPFGSFTNYSSFTYKYTDQSALQNFPIAIQDRIYSINQQTGIVTVSDRTGAQPSQDLPYREIRQRNFAGTAINGSPVLRRRLAWIADFKQLPAIRTSFRLDGNYYYYKGVAQNITAYMPNNAQAMSDGNPYKFIGYFVGGAGSANGSRSRSADMNITSTTHIPALRLIFTARLELSIYRFNRVISNYADGTQRGYVVDSRDALTPSTTKSDIYAGDQFAVVYPEYYTSFDDLDTPIPFLEKFLWAKDNDPFLFNELSKMVVRNNYNYYYNPARTSFYYSANLGVTKELGKAVSVTFNATNFINNLSEVKLSQNNGVTTLFGSGYIPVFYYGLSFRLKL